MAGAERVGNQPVAPINPSRAEEAARRRGGGSGFGERLSNDSALVRRERRAETAAPSTDETFLRERTFEELKTLVQAIQEGVTDPWQLTDLIFYARHPDMKGVPLTHEHEALLDEWNQISALLVHPTLNEVSDFLGADVLGGEVSGPQQFATAFERATHTRAGSARLSGGGTQRFDDVIAHAVQWCPGLSPAILKSLLAQESNFDTDVINRWGYAGIAQFGRAAAREVGLNVGVAGSATDERLNPDKAIPGAARLLHLKAQRLGASAFSRYGQPNGVEFWKFVLAAYNGGEGTVTLAMGHAYREGIARARAQGLVGPEAVAVARGYASKWENLKAGGLSSPLGLAAARYFPALAEMKYHEIGNYPTAIVARVSGAKG
ncbi:MAG: transglycosylase SLT domain-containing protein [Pyrinomonadaceae bacterium]